MNHSPLSQIASEDNAPLNRKTVTEEVVPPPVLEDSDLSNSSLNNCAAKAGGLSQLYFHTAIVKPEMAALIEPSVACSSHTQEKMEEEDGSTNFHALVRTQDDGKLLK